MWLKLFLCLWVAFAYANHSPGWKHNKEYVYQVRGRTLTSLNQVSNDYSGIFLKAKLHVVPRSDGHLGAKIVDAQYADFHDQLENSWRQDIPDSKLNYKQIPLSSQPFKILMDGSAVTDLIVDNTISNWESNLIKAIVSQLQLDTDAENRIRSSINIFTQEGSNSAVFKTMEKTVTGESESLYEIHPLPKYTLQTNPWLAPRRELEDQDHMYIEVVKNKNYTHSRNTPSYYYGLEVDGFDINSKIGEFFSRTSMSRAVLSGSLESFTIESSVTFDEITMNPTLQDKQRGSTRSTVNITLESMEQQEQEFQEVSNAITVGLVYSYNHPFDESNQPKSRRLLSSFNNDESSSDSNSNSQEGHDYLRQKRKAQSSFSSSESGVTADHSDNLSVQEKPHIEEAPASPLLPFTVGYDGQAISKKENIQEKVRTFAKQIGQEFQEPENIPQRNTVGKFLTLSSLVRVMNHREMKQVAAQLYTKEQHGASAFAWIAYRDAVAEAGTGPALLNIQDWIQNEKISGEEAAQVIATTIDSARQPTEKYMNILYGMIQSEQIMKQEHLNDSLLLTYTSLVHKVYVNKEQSRSRFPVYSFGAFSTEQGRRFVRKTLIPFLSGKLQEAVSKGDTKRIHVYIRALGNVGSPEVLQTFKPYLEGTKKMSQFQRVLMVTALDNLVKSKPKNGRSVLFKIYQNPRDFEQVRVAAVYLLMRANPTPAMLQRMAMYTNIDTSNHVNAAVKSSIEKAAECERPQFQSLREAARSAQPLLTSQEFGVQYSQSYLRNYLIEEMQSEVEQVVETYGGEDSAMPKGINSLLRGRFGGVKQQMINFQWMVSSVEDLINVYEQQTKVYREALKQKKSFNSVNTKWSSENTAKLLNMQNEQREQLEGYVFLQIDALQKLWSYDNRTMENLTNVLQELEQELESGKHFDFNKMANHPEIALSLPTAWGLPFIYTYDRPTLVHMEGDLKAVAKPSIASSQGLRKPENIDVEYQLNGFISGRIQSQLGFFAPFNHRRYNAGYDKNVQLQLPKISGKVHLDMNNKQATLEIEKMDRKDTKLFHFSTWPYTSQNDISNLQPQSKIVSSKYSYNVNKILGEKATGLAFNLQMTSDKPVDYGYIYELLSQKSPVSSWLDENIDHVQIDLGIKSSKSTTNKMIVHLGHQQKFSQGARSETPRGSSISQESWERQQAFLKDSSKGIKSVHSQVLDTVVRFEGQRSIKYSATLAIARSNIDPKSRVLMQLQQDDQHEQPMKVNFTVESKIPNTNSIDLMYALESDLFTTVEAQGSVGRKNEEPSQFSVNAKLSKSVDRKQYLKELPEFKESLKRMQEGNYQLPPSNMLTVQANLLDRFSMDIEYKKINPILANQTYKLYSMLRYHLDSRLSENIIRESPSKQNRFKIEGQFSPDLSAVNASIDTDYGRAEIRNLKIGPLARSLLVHHPVYDAKTRLLGHLLNYETYYPTCVIDQTAATSIDNKTYPLTLEKDWAVLLHFVPRRPSPMKNHPEMSVNDQLNEQIEGYIVYGRAYGSDNSKKEIKIVIQSPNTLGKVIDFTLKPADSSDYPRLFIQNEQIMYDDDGSHIYDDYMQVYKLPNKELKAEVYDALNVIFDGKHAKITILNDKFRDSSRGLCGTFTGEPETDFTHPGNCIIHNPEVFVATNTVPEQQRTKRMNDMMIIQAEEKKCYQKTVGYVKVVSAQDSGLEGAQSLGKSNAMTVRTKYVTNSDEICFTTHPVPVCKHGYRQNSINKEVEVHCVERSGVAQLWKRQIDQGVTLNLADKRQNNRKIMMTMADSCEE